MTLSNSSPPLLAVNLDRPARRTVEHLMKHHGHWRDVQSIARETRIPLSALHGILMRLGRHNWIECQWTTDGKHPKEAYRITRTGMDMQTK